MQIDGSSVRGYFQNGEVHGQCFKKYHQGDTFTGTIINNMKDGYGVYTWPDGCVYKGYWKLDHPSGILY